jgi:hypothetical protein
LSGDSDYAIAANYRKCWAVRAPFSGEGSNSTPSPFKQIKFERLGRAQEQSAQCASHVTVTLMLHRPSLRYTLSIPSPVKKIKAQLSKEILDEDED